MLGGSTNQRPNLRLGMSHLSTAPSNMNSSFTHHVPSPISATGSANPSPVSPVHSTTLSPLVTSPRFTNPFGRSQSLSAGSSTFPRQGRSFSQSSMMRLDGQPVATTSPSNPSLVNIAHGYGSLPPLQFTRTPFQTREDQRFGRMQTTEGPSYENGMGMVQQYMSPLSSPNILSYDQSQTFYPSGSDFRTSSSYQSSDTNFWPGSPSDSQGYQYGQQLQPHQTSEEGHGNEQSQSPLPQDSSVSRQDQRSYSLSGEAHGGVSSSTDLQPQPTMLGIGSATSRPRARSDTFPAYYGTH